jgi:hypothetical protein
MVFAGQSPGNTVRFEKLEGVRLAIRRWMGHQETNTGNIKMIFGVLKMR